MSNLLGFSLLESGASASRCAQCDASCVALLSPSGLSGWACGGKPVRSQVRLLLLATLILVGGDLPQWVVPQEVGRCRSGSCGYHCRASSVAALLAEGGSGGGGPPPSGVRLWFVPPAFMWVRVLDPHQRSVSSFGLDGFARLVLGCPRCGAPDSVN